MKHSTVLDQVVRHDLCIGCGCCSIICPSKRIVVLWSNEKGMPQAVLKEDSPACGKSCRLCLTVCPFSPQSTSAATLARKQFSQLAGIQHHPEGGYWLNSYVGFAPDSTTRLMAASGGLVTFFLQMLLERGDITAAICVGHVAKCPAKEEPLFEYRCCTDAHSVAACARSAYYPVGLGMVLKDILDTPGRYAVVVLPCMAKAVRTLCSVNPILKERISFVLGLVCGQVKTAHFSEFLAAKCGFSTLSQVDFRIKDSKYPNSNYGIRVTGNSCSEKILNFSDIARCWSDRYFTPMPCNICTDVFAETADAVFMDAWTPGLQDDWKGWNYAIVRNSRILELFEEVIQDGCTTIKRVPYEHVRNSQEGVLVSKREDVVWRIKKASIEGKPVDLTCLSHLRAPRWGRRLISETTYILSKASGVHWRQNRFDKQSFFRIMRPIRVLVEGARQVWRFYRVMEIIKMSLKRW